MYKTSILLLVLIALAALATCAPSFGAENCKSKFNVTTDELYDLQEALEEKIYSADRKFKCYTHCLLVTGDLTDANGKLSIEKLSKRENSGVLSERAIKIATECKDKFEVDEDDECEYPFQVMACITLNMRKRDDDE